MSDVDLILGTWRFVKQLKRNGDQDPNVQCPATYTFTNDGDVALAFNGGATMKMRWKLVDGKLQMHMPHPIPGQSTHPFEFPDDNTLILFDSSRRKMVFARQPDDSAV